MKEPAQEVEIHGRWVRLPPVTAMWPFKVELPKGARIIGTHPTMDGNAMWIYYVIEKEG